MEEKSKYIPLKELTIYKLSRELSSKAWEIYERLNYHQKKHGEIKCCLLLIP